jgi:hypothetical protein
MITITNHFILTLDGSEMRVDPPHNYLKCGGRGNARAGETRGLGKRLVFTKILVIFHRFFQKKLTF